MVTSVIEQSLNSDLKPLQLRHRRKFCSSLDMAHSYKDTTLYSAHYRVMSVSSVTASRGTREERKRGWAEEMWLLFCGYRRLPATARVARKPHLHLLVCMLRGAACTSGSISSLPGTAGEPVGASVPLCGVEPLTATWIAAKLPNLCLSA